MAINLSAPELTELRPRITVLGVGGAGGNPGDPVQYTIRIQQGPTSPTDAFNVKFSDPLPQTGGGNSLILAPNFTVSDSAGLVTAANFQLVGNLIRLAILGRSSVLMLRTCRWSPRNGPEIPFVPTRSAQECGDNRYLMRPS